MLVIEIYLNFLDRKEQKRLAKNSGSAQKNGPEAEGEEEEEGGGKKGNFVSASERSLSNSLRCNHSMDSSDEEHFFNCAKALLMNHKAKKRQKEHYNLRKILSVNVVVRAPIVATNSFQQTITTTLA